MNPCVDCALDLGALGGLEKGKERKERWKKEEEMGRCVGGIYHSTKGPHLSPGVFCSPSLKEDSSSLPEQMFFSKVSQEGEKRRQKLDIHLYMCRVGGVRTPKPHNNLIAYSSFPKAFLSAAANAAAAASAAASMPTLGSRARHSVLTRG